jgi:hypothetical protein
MFTRNWFALGLLVGAVSLFGCDGKPGDPRGAGGIEVSVRGATNPNAFTVLTLRRNDGSHDRWRLPIRHQPFPRRVSLPPGLYTLDYEPDVPSSLVSSASAEPAHALAGTFPRWVVVAPTRVTQVFVDLEVEPIEQRGLDGTTAKLSVPLN